MPKSIARGLVGAGAILLAILLTGCSDEPSPTPSAEAVPSPTVTAQPGVTPEPTPTPTMAPTNTPTPEPTPTAAAATLSLYEYLTQCAPPEQELADAATYGDVSVLAAELIQRLEAMVPPADLVEWHHLYIELFRTGQAMFDRFPKDDVIDNAKMDEFLLAVAPDLEEKYSDLEEKLSEVAVRLPEHLRQQMIEVDCLDPDIVPDDYDEPDDHGNNFESATRIAIGEAVAIELEFRLDKDVLVFLAEPGTEYEVTLDWESYSRLRHTARPILALFDAGGQEFARLNHYVFGSQDKMMWQAVTRGDYYIVVGDTVTDGSITLTVTDGEATEQLDRDDATVAPTHTPTPAAATLSLDEYLTLCATTEQDLADDATFGDFSSLFAAEADRLEALTPPAQLSEWHLLNIEGFRTIQAFVELQPKDDVIDFAIFILIAAAAGDLQEKLDEVYARLPEDVRRQMIEAGCIDPEDVPDDHEDVPDDHGNDIGDATAIRVGADVRGAMDYDNDIDYFRFQAERGQSYQIDVALGTLDDSIVELYDGDGAFLDTNDDYGDTLASRLYWNAPSSGERYVAVYGYGTGTYTLTVSLSNVIDDHSNSEGDATAIRVGTEVRGAVDYDNDIDFFRFQAERGQSYQIDVALGTLDDSIVELYDVDWSFLDSNDDYETFASRLYWEAPSSGERYVAVEGYGTGTYTLTVSLVDDHGNDFESATRIAIGEAVAIELANLDDMEVLVFRLAPDREYVFTLDWETYQIWDNPGSIMALYDAGGRVLVSLDDYDFSEQRIRNKIIWHAVTGGDYYIVVGDENTLGDFALTVTEGEATEPIATPAPTEPFTPPASSFVSVSAGESHTCGVKSDGSVVCWGNDENGRATPPAGSFDSVSTGWFHTCGVRSDGSVACWGANHFGQATPPAGTFVSVSAAWVHNCGVRSDGSAACWGNNASGEATPPAGSFNSVSAGDDHTCGVRSDGSVACWGDNEDGEATPPAGSFVSVSAGGHHTCGVRSDDSVACWGDDFAGDATPPAGSFVSVSAGRSHTCGVRSDGSVVCWGYTRAGAATPPAGSFVSVSAGRSHTCGVRIDGSVACWGSNYWGSDYYGQATPPAVPSSP